MKIFFFFVKVTILCERATIFVGCCCQYLSEVAVLCYYAKIASLPRSSVEKLWKATFLVIRSSSFGLVYIYSWFSNGVFVESYDQQRSTTKLLEFVRKRQAIESGAIPDHQNFENLPSSVKHLNSKTFQDELVKYPTALVMKHSRGRLLLFSSKWQSSSSMSQFSTRPYYRLCTGKN